MTTIVHLISGLTMGGAEMALYNTLAVLKPAQRAQHRVVSIMGPVGVVGEKIETLGVPVFTLGVARGAISPMAVVRLLALLRRLPNWRLQGWMYHGSFLACIACLLTLRPFRQVWSIHNSLGQMQAEKPMTRLIIRLLALFSWLPRAIIYVAQRSAQQHEAIGYCKARRRYVPNGCDTARFQPDPSAVAQLRARLSVPAAVPLAVAVGRWNWAKDYPTLFAALAQLKVEGRKLCVLLVSADMNEANAELLAALEGAGVRDMVLLLGQQDVAEIFPGCDFFVLSSRSEAMPMALVEAMLCGLPAVVTDVGDCAEMVGESGLIVPPEQPEALAKAIAQMLDADRLGLGQAARLRAEKNYSQELLEARTLALYQALQWSDFSASAVPAFR